MTRCNQTTATRLSHHICHSSRGVTRGHWEWLLVKIGEISQISFGGEKTHDKTSIDHAHGECMVQDGVAVGDDSDDGVVRALTIGTDGMGDALGCAVEF